MVTIIFFFRFFRHRMTIFFSLDEKTTSLMSKNVPQISSPSFIQQYGIIIGAAGMIFYFLFYFF